VEELELVREDVREAGRFGLEARQGARGADIGQTPFAICVYTI